MEETKSYENKNQDLVLPAPVEIGKGGSEAENDFDEFEQMCLQNKDSKAEL